LSRGIACAAFAVILIASATTPAVAARPWLARCPPQTPPAAHQLRDLDRWPAEPAEPKEIDPARFRVSVAHLCSKRMDTDTHAGDIGGGIALADLVLAAASESTIDPFLLAGLMFEQSSCKPGFTSRWGFGLTRIHPSMYRSPGAPPPPGEKADWTQQSLLDPAENLRLGAKLLRMWQDSHAELDAVFGGVPHRGPVAHFMWGDVVRGSGSEDQVLTARRRLIAFYEERPEPTTKTKWDLSLVSPLEGTPRVASSGPGEDRAGGKRRHRGIDLSAAIGEPVRAVAAGTVIFAGANLPSAPRRAIPPSQIARYRWRHLGAGGIYICIEHAPNRHIVSCYMHLDIYTITEGETVTAGQEIGRVGRTGVQVSPPHLHFELRVDDHIVDPARYLADLVIPPKATQTYRLVMRAKKLRMSRARSTPAGAQPRTEPTQSGKL
jgi:murein DD-endopeptidase MepM/ murein hydrolase activator NlpD